MGDISERLPTESMKFNSTRLERAFKPSSISDDGRVYTVGMSHQFPTALLGPVSWLKNNGKDAAGKVVEPDDLSGDRGLIKNFICVRLSLSCDVSVNNSLT